MRPILPLAMMIVAAVPSWAQPACEKLASAHFLNITITSATAVPAGPFKLPTGGANAAGVEMPATSLPWSSQWRGRR